jgi:hypothetical protein
MNRLVYMSGVALVVVALAFLLTDALLWQPGINEANARRVRPGMTLPEVEGLLGTSAAVHLQSPSTVGPSGALKIWQGKQGSALILFFGSDSTGWRVEAAADFRQEWPVPRPAPQGAPNRGLLPRVRAWMGR